LRFIRNVLRTNTAGYEQAMSPWFGLPLSALEMSGFWTMDRNNSL